MTTTQDDEEEGPARRLKSLRDARVELNSARRVLAEFGLNDGSQSIDAVIRDVAGRLRGAEESFHESEDRAATVRAVLDPESRHSAVSLESVAGIVMDARRAMQQVADDLRASLAQTKQAGVQAVRERDRARQDLADAAERIAEVGRVCAKQELEVARLEGYRDRVREQDAAAGAGHPQGPSGP